MQGAHIEAFQPGVMVLRLGLSNGGRHRGEHRVVDERSNGGGIVLLHTAFDEEESHFRALQKCLQFKPRILRADGVDGCRQVGGGCA